MCIRDRDLGISASWDTKKLTPTKIMSDVKTYIPGSDCAAIKKNGDLYTSVSYTHLTKCFPHSGNQLSVDLVRIAI